MIQFRSVQQSHSEPIHQLKSLCSMLRLFLVLACMVMVRPGFAADQPNILWLFAEDTSPWMGCYGHAINADATPNIDSLAASDLLIDEAKSRCGSLGAAKTESTFLWADPDRRRQEPDRQVS
jgi:hypothetical protein